MNRHDIFVIGASAGGVETLSSLVRSLPRDLPAVILLVVHLSAHSPSVLPAILNRAGPLPASHPVDGTVLEYGHIYVAPPDYHMLVEQDRIRLIAGPFEHYARPAIDPLFRSAARVYGPRVVGVILTGILDDGAAGLVEVKLHGGIALVQDPADALYAGMPLSALKRVQADFVLPLADIGPLLVQLAGSQHEEEEVVAEAPRSGLSDGTRQDASPS